MSEPTTEADDEVVRRMILGWIDKHVPWPLNAVFIVVAAILLAPAPPPGTPFNGHQSL